MTGAGLVTCVDASFGVRAGMAPVEVIVEEVEGLPRGKALTGGVLGDVNGDSNPGSLCVRYPALTSLCVSRNVDRVWPTLILFPSI